MISETEEWKNMARTHGMKGNEEGRMSCWGTESG